MVAPGLETMPRVLQILEGYADAGYPCIVVHGSNWFLDQCGGYGELVAHAEVRLEAILQFESTYDYSRGK